MADRTLAIATSAGCRQSREHSNSYRRNAGDNPVHRCLPQLNKNSIAPRFALAEGIVRTGSTALQHPVTQAADFWLGTTTPAERETCGGRAAGLARR